MTIRKATAGDEGAIAALWRACDLVTSYNDPGQDFRFALNRANSDILVECDETGKPVGSVMVGHDGHRGWIYYVAAAPAKRNTGIGRRLVDAAEQWLKDKGIPKAMLLVRETNTQVVDFYRHLGFEVAPRTIMQKWLTKSA